MILCVALPCVMHLLLVCIFCNREIDQGMAVHDYKRVSWKWLFLPLEKSQDRAGGCVWLDDTFTF